MNHHYAIIYCDEIDGEPRWGARLYDPFKGQWEDFGFWFYSREDLLRESEVRFRELMRENEVAEAFKLVIDDFKQKGFSLSEILNGLAELSHRDKYPDRVGFLIEQAVEEAK